MMHDVKLPRLQQGVTLAVALIILVGVTVVSLTMLSTSMLELVMAGSEEARTSAFQKSEAGLDAVAYGDGNGINFQGPNVGYDNCTSGFASKYGVTCDATTVALPTGYDATGSEMIVTRQAPYEQPAPRAMATSCVYRYGTWSIDSRFDATQTRGGRVDLIQGYLAVSSFSGDDCTSL